jgi:DNA-binding transcriptional MocR family regulator
LYGNNPYSELHMTLWKPRLAANARYKHQGIVDALQADIAARLLKFGDTLPPQREIARQLGIDLTTVTRALNEARRLDLIEARPGSGTFVKATIPQPRANAAPLVTELDLSMNIPPQPVEANLHGRIAEGIEALLAEAPAHFLSYQDSMGTEAARHAATQWLIPRFGAAPALERLVVAGGAQSALFAICSLVAARGSICTGAVAYPGLKPVAALLGIDLYPLAMDEFGIVPGAFEKCCRSQTPKALYVVPSIDNPTTATMPLERREAIAEIANRYRVTVIEDDPYAELLDQPLPAIATLAPGLTWHIATLSKCATPALRIAYVACPSPLDALRLGSSLRASNPGASPLLSALATDWISNGILGQIASAIREESRARQSLASTILKDWTYAAAPAGHHLWLTLPSQWNASEFAALARRSGLGIVPASAFSIGASMSEGVRVSLGAAPDRVKLEQGLTLLNRLLHEPQFTTGILV